MIKKRTDKSSFYHFRPDVSMKKFEKEFIEKTSVKIIFNERKSH